MHIVVGGTTSVLGGGKFENGATTAAFGYLFNQLGHCGCRGSDSGFGSGNSALDDALVSGKPLSAWDRFTNWVLNVNEADLVKVPERDGNKVAQDADYKDAHEAKKGRGAGGVDFYRDKKTGDYWLWNGTKGGGKEPL